VTAPAATSRRTWPRAAVVLILALLLSACDFDVYKLPLPGGADLGDDPIEVTVKFDDVLDLVPKSSVKVNDVTVGQVDDVDLDGYTAIVKLKIRKDVDLPANPVATIRQTSLLGEKFVSLAAPNKGAQGRLADGAVIERGGKNPEVEEVLGALSLVLNGGGVAQLKTISSELNLALEGREDSAKSVLTQIKSLVDRLDQHKGDIVNAIESVNRLAISARKHQKSIDLALDELPSALDSLDRQRGDLVKMLRGLTRLSNVGVRVINTTQTSTVNSLKALDPILSQLARAGDDFVNGFSTFLTYPFVDESVGRDPAVARNLHMGDYVNLSIDLHLNLGKDGLGIACTPIGLLPDSPLDDLINLKNLCAGATETLGDCLNNLDAKACGELPARLIDNVCEAVKLLCGRASRISSRRASDPLGARLTDALEGLGRPAPGATADEKALFQQYDATYDADLVDLFAAPLTSAPAGRTATR